MVQSCPAAGRIRYGAGQSQPVLRARTVADSNIPPSLHKDIAGKVSRHLAQQESGPSSVNALHDSLRRLAKWRSALLQETWLQRVGTRSGTSVKRATVSRRDTVSGQVTSHVILNSPCVSRSAKISAQRRDTRLTAGDFCRDRAVAMINLRFILSSRMR